MSDAPAVIWHDLECGAYRQDLDLWTRLAAECDGPVLDVGAGTGRVALELARAGHAVIALDRDPVLLGALAQRAERARLTVQTQLADARDFALASPVALCLVPMQTVQLLGGPDERAAFLACARRAVAPGGRLALAIADALEAFEVAEGDPPPLPDVGEIDGTVYASRPLAVRPDGGGFVLERRRETVSPSGDLVVEPNTIRLDRLDAGVLEQEAREAGLAVGSRAEVPPTPDYAGSAVVTLHV